MRTQRERARARQVSAVPDPFPFRTCPHARPRARAARGRSARLARALKLRPPPVPCSLSQPRYAHRHRRHRRSRHTRHRLHPPATAASHIDATPPPPSPPPPRPPSCLPPTHPQVMLKDTAPAGLARGEAQIAASLDKKVKRKSLAPFARDCQVRSAAAHSGRAAPFKRAPLFKSGGRRPACLPGGSRRVRAAAFGPAQPQTRPPGRHAACAPKPHLHATRPRGNLRCATMAAPSFPRPLSPLSSFSPPVSPVSPPFPLSLHFFRPSPFDRPLSSVFPPILPLPSA